MSWRAEFPLFDPTAHPRLAYLDAAASTPMPRPVLAAVADYQAHHHANVHRGVYRLAEAADARYAAARERVARYLKVPADSVVFTSGATAGINAVAQAFLGPRLRPGDRIAVSRLEHHSNDLPWRQIAQRTGADFIPVGLDEAGGLDMAALADALGPRTRILALTEVSNVLGTRPDLAAAIRLAHDAGIPVLVDGAQGIAHRAPDRVIQDADFYVFSGHKVYGPTGIGVLHGKPEHLAVMTPWQVGGGMVARLDPRPEWLPPPAGLEAGTPNIAGAVGLAAAFDWLDSLGGAGFAHLEQLGRQLHARLAGLPGLRRLPCPTPETGIAAFNLVGLHAHDAASLLDQRDLALRAGHHCARPLLAALGEPACLRASLGLFNEADDIERLVQALDDIGARCHVA